MKGNAAAAGCNARTCTRTHMLQSAMLHSLMLRMGAGGSACPAEGWHNGHLRAHMVQQHMHRYLPPDS